MDLAYHNGPVGRYFRAWLPGIQGPAAELWKCAVNTSVISVSDLRKAYRLYAHPRDMLFEAVTGRRRHSEYVALDKINFGVESRMVVGLIGRNGAGKSTLLR